jgi:2-polyprenyl-6-methoxyphenol hydroxylase-like FAD-dependent oxidoreductase
MDERTYANFMTLLLVDVHWGILFHRSLLRLPAKQLDKQLQKGAQLALDLTADWHPSIRCLCEMQDSALTVGTRIFSAPLKIPTWTSSSVVTILGDAAHTMSPAGGVGAVGALHDASQVVEMVAEGHVSAESIGEFEGRMRGFAETLLQRTDEASKRMLGVGLADGSVERAGA